MLSSRKSSSLVLLVEKKRTWRKKAESIRGWTETESGDLEREGQLTRASPGVKTAAEVGTDLALIWPWCGLDLALIWPWCGPDLAFTWPWSGFDLAWILEQIHTASGPGVFPVQLLSRFPSTGCVSLSLTAAWTCRKCSSARRASSPRRRAGSRVRRHATWCRRAGPPRCGTAHTVWYPSGFGCSRCAGVIGTGGSGAPSASGSGELF